MFAAVSTVSSWTRNVQLKKKELNDCFVQRKIEIYNNLKYPLLNKIETYNKVFPSSN